MTWNLSFQTHSTDFRFLYDFYVKSFFSIDFIFFSMLGLILGLFCDATMLIS